MKNVVFDSPFQDEVSMPAIAKTFVSGKTYPLTDEEYEIARTNPHIRLVTEAQTPFQKANGIESPAPSATAPEPVAAPAKPAAAPSAAAPTE